MVKKAPGREGMRIGTKDVLSKRVDVSFLAGPYTM